MTIMNNMGERKVQQTQVGHQLVMSGEAHVPRPSRQQEVQQTQVGQDPWLGYARGPGQQAQASRPKRRFPRPTHTCVAHGQAVLEA
jgi:hypothetical protein